MKCKHCNGTGTTNWCVNGTFVDCPYCGGTGEIEVEMTEQEYLQTCNAEQLAEEISYLVFGGDFKKHISKMGYINMHSFKTEIVEWLKQPHKPFS